MKADNLRIAKVFSSGGDIHYVLPHFQREYTWEKENWQTLLNDALAVYSESQPPGASGRSIEVEHFLGSIVVIHDGMRSGTISALKLVDGQQRLTTIALFLKALTALTATTHAGLSKRLEKLLVNADEEKELFFKILPTVKYGDRASYCALMSNAPVPANRSRIPQAYAFFQTALAEQLKSGVDPEHLATVVTQAFQVVFVELDDRESPYRIFESLNAKGKPLTQADLVRNYVAMRLPTAQQERVFHSHWSGIEDRLQETRKVGRLTELTAFLRHYLAMQTGVLCDEQHVYGRFRDRAEKEFSTPQLFEDELVTLCRFAKHYDGLLRPETLKNCEIGKVLHRLNALETSSSFPFLLRLFDEFASGRLSLAQLKSCLAFVESYMVRRYIGGEPANYLNRIFPVLWGTLDSTNIVQSLRTALSERKCPGNARVVKALGTRQMYDPSALVRRKTTLILETINRFLSAGTGGYTVLDGSPTIEHVMPQTLSEPWMAQLGIMHEQVHRDLVHTLGNLTLITGEWNSELSNGPFATKKERLSQHALRINNTYFSKELPQWGRAEILERTSSLASAVLTLWPSLADNDDAAEDLVAEDAGFANAEFHFEAAERVAGKLGVGLQRLGDSRYESPAGTHRLVGLCSKPYKNEGQATRYWFGFTVSQREFLQFTAEAWLALECETPSNLLLLPLKEFEPLLPLLNQTVGKHWHISLRDAEGHVHIWLAGTREQRDLTAYLI